MTITPRLLAYLKSWYETSTRNQRQAGVEVRLTFDEFRSLFKPRQLASLEKAIERNRLRYQQNEKREFAYVLTWKSYAACSTGVLSVDTATVCSRMKSATINLPARGDTLRPSHRSNIGQSLTGKPKSDGHCKAISDGKKGRSIAGWSEERKAERRALRQAQETAKRKATHGNGPVTGAI